MANNSYGPNSSSGNTGQTQTRKRKVSKGNRVARFRDWSPEHKQAVLDKLGVSLDDYRGLDRGGKSRLLGQAFDRKPGHGGHHGGGGTGGAPAPAMPGLTDPLNSQQAMGLADKMAGLTYDAPLAQVAQQQANVNPWFEQYRAQVLAAPQALAAQTQPNIDQAQQAAANQKPLAGGDPNSQAGHDDVLAAAGRQAIIQAGVNQLMGMQNAASTYFQQVGNVAIPAYQQNVTSQLGNQRQDLLRQRGQAKATAYGDIRNDERRYGLERAAFQVDTQDTLEDNARQDQQNRYNRRRQRRQDRQQGQPSALDLARYDVNRNGKLDPGEAVKRDKAKGTTTKPPTAGAQKISAKIRTGVALVRKHDNGLPGYWHDAYNRLVEQDGLDPIIARAIVNGARTGRVGNNTAKALLKEYGISSITIPGAPKKRKGPTAIKRPDNAGSAYGDRPT